MKKIFAIYILSLLFFVAPAMADDAENMKITIVADEWCPYNCEPGTAFPGYMVEVAKQAFEPLGYNVEYSKVPWERAVQGTKDGIYDGAIGPSQSDVPELIYPAEPLGVNSNAIFTRKDSTWEYKGVESLAGISLAVVEGYTYGEEIDKYITKNSKDPSKIQAANSDEALHQNIKKLQFSRVDAIMENRNVAEYKLRQVNFADGVKVAGEIKQQPFYSDLYIGFSPKRKDAKKLADILSESIKRMRANGELKKILDRYNVPDWKQ